MLKALNKPRSSKQHLIIHMKVLLLVIIGALLWQSPQARKATSDMLYEAAEFVRPEMNPRFSLY